MRGAGVLARQGLRRGDVGSVVHLTCVIWPGVVHQLVLFSSASVGTPLRTRQRGSRVRDPVSGWGLVLTTQTTQLFPIVVAEVVGL